jgi:hypothetical protein
MFAGYPMAMTLRQKMPSSHTLIVQDVNPHAVKRFIAEAKNKCQDEGPMKIETAKTAREVAERAVRRNGTPLNVQRFKLIG